MGDWVKKFIVRTLTATLSKFVVLPLVAFGIATLAEKWTYLQDSPWRIWVISAAYSTASVLCIAGVASLIVYLRGRDGYLPRYFLWYSNRFRKISWNFNSLLGIGGYPAEGIACAIHGFQFTFTVNRGRVIPRKCYIRCNTTGNQLNIMFDVNGQDVSTQEIDFIPKGSLIKCHSTPWNRLEKDDFLKAFVSPELVFEYDNTRFTKKFSRQLLEGVIAWWWLHAYPRPTPQPQLKQAV